MKAKEKAARAKLQRERCRARQEYEDYQRRFGHQKLLHDPDYEAWKRKAHNLAVSMSTEVPFTMV